MSKAYFFSPQSLIADNDGIMDAPGMFSERTKPLIKVYSLLFTTLSVFLSWPGLQQEENNQILIGKIFLFFLLLFLLYLLSYCHCQMYIQIIIISHHHPHHHHYHHYQSIVFHEFNNLWYSKVSSHKVHLLASSYISLPVWCLADGAHPTYASLETDLKLMMLIVNEGKGVETGENLEKYLCVKLYIFVG